MELKEAVEKYENNELSCEDFIEKLENKDIEIPNMRQIEFNRLTKPIRKKYRDETGNGVMIDLCNEPSNEVLLISLLKATANKDKAENYFTEVANDLYGNNCKHCLKLIDNKIYNFDFVFDSNKRGEYYYCQCIKCGVKVWMPANMKHEIDERMEK